MMPQLITVHVFEGGLTVKRGGYQKVSSDNPAVCQQERII